MSKGGRPKIKDESQLKKKFIGFYVTEKEYSDIVSRVPLHFSLSEGFRNLVLGNKMPNTKVDISIDKFILETNKIGNNINQITKKINTNGLFSDVELHEIKNEISKLNKVFASILETVKTI